MKILINGSRGRMGVAIAVAAEDMGVGIAGECDMGDDPAAFIADCDAVIDFSFHEVTPGIAALAAEHGKPLIIGTTGHSDEERGAILACTAKIPIVWAGNYSVGVNVLNYLVQKAAGLLDKSYQPEVIEMHHRHKKDAPSGTAERLVEIVREARGLTREQEQHGRKGITGERPDDEIGVHALRGGDVIGDHTVLFAGPGERVELTHKASNRQIFAQGAVRAAQWATGSKPGLYDMQDVLGLT